MKSKKLKLINLFVKKYGYKTYLEIGCRKKKTLNGVKTKKKYGVDPVYPAEFKMTSDKFFLKNKKTFDIVLIEGNRQGDHPYNDIVNSLKVLNENGTIIVRGANQPKSWFYNKKLKIPRYKETVWLAVSKIHIERDLVVMTAKDENGLSVIRMGGKRLDCKDEITKEYFLANRKRLLNLVSWETIKDEISRPDGAL